MAGDWLKIEKATPDKSEVFKLARLLGIDRDTAFGKLFRFWAWLDTQSVDGAVDGVTSTDVDALVACPGFTCALSSVGWVEFDDDNERVCVPNYDRHNGESSKKRALKSQRQARWREKTVDVPASTPASTREEKRREEVKERKNGTRFVPPTPDEVSEYCRERGNRVDPSRFCDFYTAKGWVVGKSKMKDWRAAVRNWEKSDTEKPVRSIFAGGK